MGRPRAFSLIELLVVLAVISLLIGLLLPVLGSARAAAHSAACLSNQQQLTLGLLAYTQDYDGRVVPHHDDRAGGRAWWFGFEAGGPSGGINRPLDPAGSPLAPYFGDDIAAGLACPAFPIDDPKFVAKFANRSAHFGYNGGLAGPLPGATPRALVEVPKPAKVFAFADAVHQDGGTTFYEPHSVNYRRPGRITGTAHYRHHGKANVAWLDGHVAAHDPPATETVWQTVAGNPLVNLDTTDGPGSAYGFATWTDY